MKHYYADVPDLGNVAVSRHAQERIRADRIAEATFEEVLFRGEMIAEGFEVVIRRGSGIQIVILLKPKPFAGAKLVKTVFKTGAQANAKQTR